MKRRDLIKTLGISAVGLATVPLWVDSWATETLPVVDSKGDTRQKIILAELVGMIIPATDTPGAKELEVDRFILTMLADCYHDETQNNFFAGLDELDSAAMDRNGKSFDQLTEVQQAQLFSDMEKEQATDDKFNFASFTKGLTIAGYTNSEYYMTNILHYELVPSRFNGSFPVRKSIYKNA